MLPSGQTLTPPSEERVGEISLLRNLVDLSLIFSYRRQKAVLCRSGTCPLIAVYSDMTIPSISGDVFRSSVLRKHQSEISVLQGTSKRQSTLACHARLHCMTCICKVDNWSSDSSLGRCLLRRATAVPFHHALFQPSHKRSSMMSYWTVSRSRHLPWMALLLGNNRVCFESEFDTTTITVNQLTKPTVLPLERYRLVRYARRIHDLQLESVQSLRPFRVRRKRRLYAIHVCEDGHLMVANSIYFRAKDYKGY